MHPVHEFILYNINKFLLDYILSEILIDLVTTHTKQKAGVSSQRLCKYSCSSKTFYEMEAQIAVIIYVQFIKN